MEFSFPDSASIASIALRSLALLVLTAGIGFALRRRSSAVQHGIWAVGMAGCSAMPIVMAFSPSFSLPLLPEGLSISVSSFNETTSKAPVSPAVIFSASTDGSRSVSDFEQPVASQAFETLQHLSPEESAGNKQPPPIPGLLASKTSSLESALAWIWMFGICTGNGFVTRIPVAAESPAYTSVLTCTQYW